MKGTRLPHDWKPSEQDVVFCKGLGLQSHQIDWVLRHFVDYFTGPDATKPVKKDWNRAFRNWADRDAWRARKVEAPACSFNRDDDGLWRIRISWFLQSKKWPNNIGAKPGERGCEAPPHILREFNLA